MAAALHIDIYSIVLVNASLILFLYLLSRPLLMIRQSNLRTELDKIMSGYTTALGPGDWIVWPLLLTLIFPIYALMRLCLKGLLCELARSFIYDVGLLRLTLLIVVIWGFSTVFALLHWFLPYALVFIGGVILFVRLRGREKMTQ